MSPTPNYQRFIDLIRVVEKEHPENFDMHDGHRCACALYFGSLYSSLRNAEHFGLFQERGSYIFGGFLDYGGNYSGNAAKLELLRRIREVLGLPKRSALEPKP